MARNFRIFPSIGIARVGDSKSGCYVGSEAPELGFVPPNRRTPGRTRFERTDQANGSAFQGVRV